MWSFHFRLNIRLVCITTANPECVNAEIICIFFLFFQKQEGKQNEKSLILLPLRRERRVCWGYKSWADKGCISASHENENIKSIFIHEKHLDECNKLLTEWDTTIALFPEQNINEKVRGEFRRCRTKHVFSAGQFFFSLLFKRYNMLDRRSQRKIMMTAWVIVACNFTVHRVRRRKLMVTDGRRIKYDEEASFFDSGRCTQRARRKDDKAEARDFQNFSTADGDYR